MRRYAEIPLNDDAAELAVLGSVLLDHRTLDDITPHISDRDFYDPANGTIFAHVLAIRAAGKPVDVTLLVDAIKTAGQFEEIGGASYIARIAESVPNAAHAVHYAQIVREKSLRRDMVAAAETLRLIAASEEDPAKALSAAEEQLFAIGERHAKSDHTTDSMSLMKDALQRLASRKEGKITDAMPTGYHDLDRIVRGLRPGELIILAGRPSMGKSALALNIAEDVSINRGLPSMAISLEMTSEQIGDRLLASQARVDLDRVMKGQFNRDESRRLQEAAARISAAPITVDDAPSRSMAELSAIVRRQHRKHKLHLLVVDYLQLIDADNARDNRQEQVAKLSRQMKHLARELRIPILCLSQLNRTNEGADNKRPRLSNLRESGAIEQDADMVMFVHREAYYDREQRETSGGQKAEIIVEKQRNGPVATAHLMWFPELVRFDNASQRTSPQFDSEPAVRVCTTDNFC